MKLFNESKTKTYLFVIICKKLISMEIAVIFEQKEKNIYSLLPEILKNKKAYLIIFNKYDLEKIYDMSEKIMLDILLKRYKNLPVPVFRFKRINNNQIHFFNFIPGRQKKIIIKKNFFLKKTFLYLKILLSKFRTVNNINNMYIEKESNKLSKELKSLKHLIKKDINNQITNTFALTHNLLINAKNKNSILKITNDEAQKTEMLEA